MLLRAMGSGCQGNCAGTLYCMLLSQVAKFESLTSLSSSPESLLETSFRTPLAPILLLAITSRSSNRLDGSRNNGANRGLSPTWKLPGSISQARAIACQSLAYLTDCHAFQSGLRNDGQSSFS